MKILCLGHSGFLVELEHSVLIFDYSEGVLPKLPKGKQVYVFVSHAHHDHYNTRIWEISSGEGVSLLSYILSDDIPCPSKMKNVTMVSEHQKYTVGSCQIETLHSTDEGVAFVLEVEGKSIYYAGDLNSWRWEGDPESDNQRRIREYTEEIDRIKGRSFDLAFVVLDPRQESYEMDGMDVFLEKTSPKLVIPMHFWGESGIIDRYLNERKGITVSFLKWKKGGEHYEF